MSQIYTGVFGGVGVLSETDFKQYGTVYLIDAQGGPLAVNWFGDLNSVTI